MRTGTRRDLQEKFPDAAWDLPIPLMLGVSLAHLIYISETVTVYRYRISVKRQNANFGVFAVADPETSERGAKKHEI